MKNKLSLVIISLYVLLIILFSFSFNIINDINIAIASNITKENVNLIINILHYFELFVFYGGFGICITIVCIDYFDNIRYIIVYSILLGLLMVIISMLIKSFYISIDVIDVLVMFLSVILGFVIELLVKIKQIRGEKDEK